MVPAGGYCYSKDVRGGSGKCRTDAEQAEDGDFLLVKDAEPR